MNKLIGLLFFSAYVGLTVGCSASGSITELDPLPSVVSLSKTSNAELVVGSNQSSKTASNYKVQSSVGQKVDKLEIVTASGYKVYQSVQGELVLEKAQR